jgi:hypothetical protein
MNACSHVDLLWVCHFMIFSPQLLTTLLPFLHAMHPASRTFPQHNTTPWQHFWQHADSCSHMDSPFHNLTRPPHSYRPPVSFLRTSAYTPQQCFSMAWDCTQTLVCTGLPLHKFPQPHFLMSITSTPNTSSLPAEKSYKIQLIYFTFWLHGELGEPIMSRGEIARHFYSLPLPFSLPAALPTLTLAEPCLPSTLQWSNQLWLPHSPVILSKKKLKWSGTKKSILPSPHPGCIDTEQHPPPRSMPCPPGGQKGASMKELDNSSAGSLQCAAT